VRLRPLASLVVILVLVSAACEAEQGPLASTATGASGSTTQAQADEAMSGLCAIAAGGLSEMADVHDAFHGRAHETLHAVAAQTQEIDAVVAGSLLEAKAVVETDLEEAAPPADLPTHAQALVVVFAAALETIGLQATACAPA
jgi:hypothetical protein